MTTPEGLASEVAELRHELDELSTLTAAVIATFGGRVRISDWTLRAAHEAWIMRTDLPQGITVLTVDPTIRP